MCRIVVHVCTCIHTHNHVGVCVCAHMCKSIKCVKG